MKLTFTIEPIPLTDARALAERLLALIQAGARHVDALPVADLCIHVLEPKRKSKDDPDA